MNTFRKLLYFLPLFGIILDTADDVFGWNTVSRPTDKLLSMFAVAWHAIFALGFIFE